MRAALRRLVSLAPLALLALLALVLVLAVPGRSSACDDAREAAREAGRAAQRAAERAQRTAERVARQAAERAQIAAEQAQYAAERAAERAQIEADEGSERAAAEAERVARAAQRNAERASRRAAARAACGSGGVVATDGGLLFVDGPEVPWAWVESADDARSRRIVRPMVTDTVLSVSPGITLALANLSGDIVVRVWDRSEVRIRAEHDRSDSAEPDRKTDDDCRGWPTRPDGTGGPTEQAWRLPTRFVRSRVIRNFCSCHTSQFDVKGRP